MTSVLLVLFFFSTLFAQIISTPSQNHLKKPAKTFLPNSQELRGTSIGSVMIGHQLITSWLPSKKTLSYTHVFNQKWALEGEYSFANIDSPFIGIDLGEINERRLNIHARRFVSNSFHFTFGLVINDFRAEVGNEIINSYGNNINSSFSAQNLGLTGGLANRWQWSNGFTLGLDWIRLNVPILELSVRDGVLNDISGSDRNDIQDVIITFNKIPTFVLFGMNFGYTF